MRRFPSVAQRRLQPEIMDQPDLAPERHRLALRGLARINRWSGSSRLLWPAIRRCAQKARAQPLHLLDVATGGGDVPIRLWHQARRVGVPLEIAACDRSPLAVDYARRQAQACQAKIDLFPWDVIQDGLPGQYDVVMSSLFLHHLDERHAEELLRGMAQAAQRLVLINDLVRGRAGYLLAYLGTRLLSTSDVVHQDGPRSVAAAFTVAEFRRLADQAGLPGARITRHWPGRMLLKWERP